MPLTPSRSVEFPKHLEIALTYAEESSKRACWVVFLLLLTVALVTYMLWQQNEMNWANSRVALAQAAVELLMCHPEEALEKKYTDRTTSDLIRDRLNNPRTTEDRDDAVACTASLIDRNSKKIKFPARDQPTKIDIINYARTFNFSLVRAKAQLAELQHLRNTRFGISIPVLGVAINIDLNDLSFIAAITFYAILLWLYFSLVREAKNLKKTLVMAEAVGLETLRIVYDLLSMNQFLTAPLGAQHISRQR